MNNKYPLVAVKLSDLTVFVVTAIDFDLEQVYNTTSQTGSGEWYGFDEIYFMENLVNELSIHDLIFNSDTNYTNYDKINGDETIYGGRFEKNRDGMNNLRIKRKELEIKETEKSKTSAESNLDSANQRIKFIEKDLSDKKDELEQLYLKRKKNNQ